VRQQLRENEFSELLDGTSVATFLFFDAEVGKAIGPIKGTDAWYIARVNSRTPPKKRMDVKNERDRELVLEDYRSHRFMQWANEVIQKAVIE
jgi:parvulin-like peptidyl-prolyl isomerase